MRRARTACVVGILAVAIGAAALRLPRLSMRIMHGDEANQAVKTARLLETGRYEYNPHDHHGPSLYYLALPVLWASGAETAPEVSDSMLRFTPAVFGVLAVLLLVLMTGGPVSPSPVTGGGRGADETPGYGLAPAAAVGAAVLATLSPALVFYSRYYVQ